MEDDGLRRRRKLRNLAACLDAGETKGADEHSRSGKMAAWTKRRGKDDARNPQARRTEPPRK